MWDDGRQSVLGCSHKEKIRKQGAHINCLQLGKQLGNFKVRKRWEFGRSTPLNSCSTQNVAKQCGEK